jgi:CheY-like chemotaxis protein
MAELACEICESNNYKTRMFRSASDALAELEAIKPDLIVMDLYMPGMTGNEFMRRVSNLPVRATPIVVLTGDPDAEDHMDPVAKKLNVRVFIKPYGLNHLADYLRAAGQSIAS